MTIHGGLEPRAVFCNRTLNLRRIEAIGYDFDYTLVHYHMEVWEQRAYAYIQEALHARGWPVDDLVFDSSLAARGLMLDVELGNVVKANRFGYVVKAFHGTEPLSFDAQRRAYERTIVDLREPRWIFLNTLFSISEACMFMQLVDRLDAGALPEMVDYAALYQRIRRALDAAHAEGRLKQEIIADPDKYVDLDPDTPRALLDQKRAGKTLLLITNSEWFYGAPMLRYVFDRYLPDGKTWRDLFDYGFFTSRKPGFFSNPERPAYQIVNDEGLLREHRGKVERGGLYVGGNARLVEESLGLDGSQILYVGDHLFVDVNIAKSILRWRTALIAREVEDEVAALVDFAPKQARLSELMQEKESLEVSFAEAKLATLSGGKEAQERYAAIKAKRISLDEQITPLAIESGTLHNANWGLLFRSGSDKSHLARQVERYADVYTSRVSNFAAATPYMFFRAPRSALPHDPA